MKIMEKYITTILVTLLFFCKYAVANGDVSTTKNLQLYIVYMGEHSYPDSDSVISSNHDLLASVTGSTHQAKEATTHHYHKSFRGFTAKLTPEQAQKLRETESVISVFESKNNQLHTTHSWDFLGINDIPPTNELTKLDPKSDVIVGVFDSGVWPESKSFDDDGLGPIPTRFKGECVEGDLNDNFACNRKIIGARFYTKGYKEEVYGLLNPIELEEFLSPRDSYGHGTHTASTIAGTVVNNVSFSGMARGTARGGMPNARLAIYKVCWADGNVCTDADLLSAFDDAIHDGVDIISMSIGGPPTLATNLFQDAYSIGSFHAFKNNILVSASAGNSRTLDGHIADGDVGNGAPWILTVAASSIDRELSSYVGLGNSLTLKGSGINAINMDKYYGIIFGEDAVNYSSTINNGGLKENARLCLQDSLNHTLIKDKIVVCAAKSSDYNNESRSLKGYTVQQGGGKGMILHDPHIGNDLGPQHVLQTTYIGTKEKEILRNYSWSEKNPTATIYQTRTVISNTIKAPKIAVFSSKGPNFIAPDIIKPDITAPGVNILAAWPPASRKGVGYYKFLSGTSMSCPHVSAVAAIIKSHHPSWSPAAIKSAIMTTAYNMTRDNTPKGISDPKGHLATPFDYGSGHINPSAALNPGLVYDFNTSDIVNFLCSPLTSPPSNLACENYPRTATFDLNYPSIGIAKFDALISALRTAPSDEILSVSRTVTYVGNGPAVFTATWDMTPGAGVKVIVKPQVLEFKEAGEKMSFTVGFVPLKTSYDPHSPLFGSITWSHGPYKVRSPIGLNVAPRVNPLKL